MTSTEHLATLEVTGPSEPSSPVAVVTVTPSAFAPFAIRRFRWFWIAAVFSNAGTWMQQLAVPIAVHQATGKATWIGITAMSGLVPSLVANSFSGTIADRFERRVVLFATQFALALCALMMWVIFGSKHPSMLAVCSVVAVSALISGVSMTTWQSFVPTLVPRELLAPAVRLNSMQFAMGRALGPLSAALAIARYGPRIGFIANAASYLTVLVVLAVMPKVERIVAERGPALRQIVDGWRYVASHRSLVLPALTNLVTGACGFAFVSLAAPIALERFHRTRAQSGWLAVGFGCGGIIGMIVVSLIGERVRRSRLVPICLYGWVVGLVALAYVPTFFTGILAMVIVGIGQVTTASSLNTSLQMQVDEQYRGRAISVYMWGIATGVPLGTLMFGAVIDHSGVRPALLIGAAMLAAYSLSLRRLGLRYVDEPHPAGPPLRRARAV